VIQSVSAPRAGPGRPVSARAIAAPGDDGRADLRAGGGCGCRRVCGSGLASGSGCVAVAGMDWVWQCGHFEW
jgi:hypothetical protein